MPQNKDRVVLAYSGGLDTSVAIGWIAEQTGMEVVTVAVDLGQGGEDLETIRQRALDCGAVEAYVADARDERLNDLGRRERALELVARQQDAPRLRRHGTQPRPRHAGLPGPAARLAPCCPSPWCRTTGAAWC